jgi:hypothetical protein
LAVDRTFHPGDTRLPLKNQGLFRVRKGKKIPRWPAKPFKIALFLVAQVS